MNHRHRSPQPNRRDFRLALIAMATFGLLLIGTAVASSGCSLIFGGARHAATQVSSGLYDKLQTLSVKADEALTTGAITAVQRQTIAKYLAPAIEKAKEFNTAVLNWQPGDEVPESLKALAGSLSGLVNDALNALGDSPVASQLRAIALKVQDEVIKFLTS
jgi:hypothetical protein